MKTTATNRKVRELLTALRDTKLIPRPEFQRRLVWSNKDKVAFIETVLLGYPFPEIYVAAGDVDLESGEANEMLVDGQQRVTTLNSYFLGTDELRLPENVKPYAQLSKDEKETFLQYDVVVRDLGKLTIEAIKQVFLRINNTSYSLNAMEIHNARYGGKFKEFAEELAQHAFFEEHGVFRPADVRRMQDTLFMLLVVSTVMSTYFNRDSALEEFLTQYDDEFPDRQKVGERMTATFAFIDSLKLSANSRAWQKADLFTLLVEVDSARTKDKLPLKPKPVASKLASFYAMVEVFANNKIPVTKDSKLREQAQSYFRAILKSTNDRGSRLDRGNAIRFVLRSTVDSD